MKTKLRHPGRTAFAIIFAALFFHGLLEAGPFTREPMRKPAELIGRQAAPVIYDAAYARLTPDTAHLIVSLTLQRAWLMDGDAVALDTPISSGKRAGMTPAGDFSVLEKDPNHRSNVFGDFVDAGGRVVRAGVSTKIDSAPSGSHYIGAPMKWFMRLSNEGVGMHIGILPGYPASHGCVRLPAEIALKIYQKVKVGTPVVIVP